jgi:hypothetical protein
VYVRLPLFVVRCTALSSPEHKGLDFDLFEERCYCGIAEVLDERLGVDPLLGVFADYRLPLNAASVGTIDKQLLTQLLLLDFQLFDFRACIGEQVCWMTVA